MVRQSIIVGSVRQSEAAYLMAARKQKERENQRKRTGTRYNLQKHAPMTYFLQKGPTS
jgi:hypothetical protein